MVSPHAYYSKYFQLFIILSISTTACLTLPSPLPQSAGKDGLIVISFPSKTQQRKTP